VSGDEACAGARRVVDDDDPLDADERFV